MGAVDADAAGPRAAADVLAALIAQLVEVADAGERLADVANVVLLDAAAAGEQRRAELGQRVAVGRGQADAGDDDAVVVGKRRGHESGSRLQKTSANVAERIPQANAFTTA